MAAQMDHYRSYANEAATKNWTDDSLVHGDTPVAAAKHCSMCWRNQIATPSTYACT